MRTFNLFQQTIASAVGVVLLTITGCNRASETGDNSGGEPPKPKQAATQLEKAFAAAPVEVKKVTQTASEAVRGGDYEKAIVALQTVKERGNLTFDQGMAVHDSMVAMEASLIAGVTAGDPKAKRAFELLKALKKQ